MFPARLGQQAEPSEAKPQEAISTGAISNGAISNGAKASGPAPWQIGLGRTLLIGGILATWLLCLFFVLNAQAWTGGVASLLAILAHVTPGQWVIDPAAAPAVADGVARKLLVLLTGATPVLLLEICVLGYGGSSLRRLTTERSASATYDLAIFALVFTGLWRFWGILGTLGGGYLVGWVTNHLMGVISGHELQIDTGSVALNLLVYLLALTFFDYWTHWLLHRKPFWSLHRMHHSATDMTVLSLFRNHPGIVLVEPITKLLPLAFFAAPPGYLLPLAYLLIGYQFLIHSNVRWTWGWFGRWVVQPPMAHRMHHMMRDEYVGSMLGIIPLWDRLFGTWRPLELRDLPIGVTDASYNSGRFLQEVWRDLVEFASGALACMTRKSKTAAPLYNDR